MHVCVCDVRMRACLHASVRACVSSAVQRTRVALFECYSRDLAQLLDFDLSELFPDIEKRRD